MFLDDVYWDEMEQKEKKLSFLEKCLLKGMEFVLEEDEGIIVKFLDEDDNPRYFGVYLEGESLYIKIIEFKDRELFGENELEEGMFFTLDDSDENPSNFEKFDGKNIILN